jgi:hypothetical protein
MAWKVIGFSPIPIFIPRVLRKDSDDKALEAVRGALEPGARGACFGGIYFGPRKVKARP